MTFVACPVHAVPVTLRFSAPDANRVNLAGTFNGWKPDALAMVKSADGTWSATTNLEPGGYQYKFVVDGRWTADPAAGAPLPSSGNSVLWVTPDGSTPVRKLGDGQIVAFAVKHQPADVIKVDKTHARFTVHTAAADVSSICLGIWEDAVTDSAETYSLATSGSDGVTETWSVVVPVQGKMTYFLSFEDRIGRWQLGNHGLLPETTPQPMNATNYFEVNMDSLSLYETPQWAKDAVWYQIFPERFFNGSKANDRKPPMGVPNWNTPLSAVPNNPNDNYWGGDLKGVIAKLPYLKSLGITALYLNPIFKGPDTHKYATTDYLQVDPDFGNEKTLKTLCDAAHRNGMRVMLDGVFNHTSVYNPMFRDVIKNQQKSKYANWYHIRRWPVLDPVTHYKGADERNIPYDGWWGIKWMPKLNTSNPECQAYLLKVATRWIEHCGIDGWRLDVANEVSSDFWRKFRPAVKDAKKDALIVGEIWEDASPWLQGDQFDSVMNYPFRAAVLDFFARGKSDAATFTASVTSLLNAYPPQASAVMFNMVGSHDVPRLMNECREDPRKAALATVFQMCWAGAPCIYYGDEIGMTAGGDPWNRAPMIWDESRWNKELRESIKRAVALRKAHPGLRTTNIETLETAANKVAAFVHNPRTAGMEVLITAFNASADEQTVTLPFQSVAQSARWKDIWNGGDLTTDGDRLPVTLKPYGAVVLLPTK